MKKLINLFLMLILSGCSSMSVAPQKTITPIETNNGSVELTALPTDRSPKETSKPLCEGSIEYIGGYFMKHWSYSENILFYTNDLNRENWQSYPETDKVLKLNDVFPFLPIEIESMIHAGIGHLAQPRYSFSPSGTHAIYWEEAYTKPTPTPDSEPGLISSTEREYLKDIYLVTVNDTTPRFIARVEGDITNAYWSKDESLVYLTFELLFLPGDFLVQIDLKENSTDVILPEEADLRYWNWIALSPDEKWLAYNHSTPNEIYILNLETKERIEIDDLPEYVGMIWLDDDRWLFVDSDSRGTIFYEIEAFSNNILSKDQFRIELAESFYGASVPTFSIDKDKLAFRGVGVDNESNGLYIYNLCPSP